MHLFNDPDKMILNPYRFAPAGGGAAFGNASRSFVSASSQYINLAGITGIGALVGAGNGCTLAAWVKVSSPSTRQAILADWNSSAIDESIVVEINSSKVRGLFRPGGIATAISSTGTLSADTWHHVAAIYDYGVDCAVALDGTVSGATARSGNLNNGAQAAIGRGGAWSSIYMNGNIADVRIYNRGLSDSEISDLAAGTDVSSGLVGWWLRNTDDVLDYAGSNDGTNNGSTYSTDGPLD